MPAPTDVSGTMKYWFGGLPYASINKSTNDMGTMKFWFGGVPRGYIFGSTITSSTRLMMMGMGT